MDISWGWNTFFLLILVFFAVVTVSPVVQLISRSFTADSTANIAAVKAFGFIPYEWSLEGYRYLFALGDQLWRSYLVSFGYATLGTAFGLLLGSMFAYVLYQSQYYFPWRKAYTIFLFVTMVFGGGLVPFYMLITQYLHLNDTFLLYIVTANANIIILRVFMKTSVPDSLLEAARIDGAGHFRIYVFVVMPLMKAALATQALFGFVGRWNDWFTGLLYMEKPWLIPLQTMLWRMQQQVMFLVSNSEMARAAGPEYARMLANLPRTSLVTACTVVAVVPVLFLYPFFQRYFIQGLLVGSLKE